MDAKFENTCMDQDQIFDRIAARIARGGVEGRGVFLHMAKRAFETAGAEALEQWTSLTFYKLPKPDQTSVVALLLNIAFKAKAVD